MLTKVTPGHEVVALLPQKPHSRTYYMGTVILAEGRIRHEGKKTVVIGEVLHEATEQDQPTHKVRGRMHKYKRSMGEITAKGVYVVGATIWISKEVQDA